MPAPNADTPASRPVTLDFATDASLAADVAALTSDDHARLCRVVRQAEDTEFERDLLGHVRADLAEGFPTRTAIGVLFEPTAEDNDHYLTSDGTVLFDDDTVDFVYFDEAVGRMLAGRWPNVGRQFTVAVDLRGEGKVTASRAGHGIHTWFTLPRPT